MGVTQGRGCVCSCVMEGCVDGLGCEARIKVCLNGCIRCLLGVKWCVFLELGV